MKAIIKIPKGTIGFGETKTESDNIPCPEDLTVTFEHENLEVSDGYHTFDELYDHRIELYIALCRTLERVKYGESVRRLVWRSKVHSDGSVMEGWFILGIGIEEGKQITYHLPLARWNDTDFAFDLERAPEWDGHTSADVLERIKTI